MIIGCDIDGVLANFNQSYIELLTKQTGIIFPYLSDTYPDVWDYDKAAGCTRQQLNTAWRTIKSRTFWKDLEAYPGAVEFLAWLSSRQDDDVYFITSRPGDRAKEQTEKWLKRHGFFGSPTVLISSQKGAICSALNVNYYIDDKMENCIDVKAQSPATLLYIKACPYNAPIEGAYRGSLELFQAGIDMGGL